MRDAKESFHLGTSDFADAIAEERKVSTTVGDARRGLAFALVASPGAGEHREVTLSEDGP